ncbi:PHP domain-containing protein [Gracilibacillus suaedae]|uniref:PHP domain-containing protein n=1 Tax=Gracilibacillus suaedae TaxID=2820273 RepID=UPI001E46B533|nr:PHP domain-containing protein [Gracilibacillus suaedae]
MKIIDLHIHSTFSDGELTPEQIIAEAENNHVSTIAITDHDEIGGYIQIKKLAKGKAINVISGIELNTDGPDGELHILGYHVDQTSSRLLNHIEWRKRERQEWATKIVNQLRKIGYQIDIEQCMQKTTGDIIVRTHIAEVLVDNGYFSTAQRAYQELLVKGKAGFVPRATFTATQAIALIHDAGGTAYLAHPGIYPKKPDISRLMDAGLDGMEVFHSKHSLETTRYWEAIASEHSLWQSGGSDYHGPNSRNPYPIGSVELSPVCLKQWLSEVNS